MYRLNKYVTKSKLDKSNKSIYYCVVLSISLFFSFLLSLVFFPFATGLTTLFLHFAHGTVVARHYAFGAFVVHCIATIKAAKRVIGSLVVFTIAREVAAITTVARSISRAVRGRIPAIADTPTYASVAEAARGARTFLVAAAARLQSTDADIAPEHMALHHI